MNKKMIWKEFMLFNILPRLQNLKITKFISKGVMIILFLTPVIMKAILQLTNILKDLSLSV